MTKKQFKEALLRGQGRCIQAAQKDPEKYRSVVLWACSHVVAFDAQCEGTRAWFVHQLISCYQDKSPFLEAIINGIRNTKSNGSWKVLYLAELLSHFAEDGEEAAKQALWCKYAQLYSALMKKRSLPDGYFAERDDFEHLCIVLADNKAAMLEIAEDIGRLYRERPFYDGWSFDYLFSVKAEKYRKALEKQAERLENTAAYLRAGDEELERQKEQVKTWQGSRTGRALSVWLKRNGDEETVQGYADAYLRQTDPQERAKALEMFSRCPFPGDPTPVIEDAKSDFEPLKNAAWWALENICHPIARTFAMENLNGNIESALPVFIRNYHGQDAEFLVEAVMAIPVDFECTTIWHGAQLDVLSMEDYGLKAPAALLRYIYESSYCSRCRHNALRQLGKRRLLTNAILEECLLDSYEDNRTYARKCLHRRKRK